MGILAEDWKGEVVPSRAFAEGGIHEAIMEYENNVFFDILAEDLARRDMDDVPIDESNYEELNRRIDAYIANSTSTAPTTSWWTATRCPNPHGSFCPTCQERTESFDSVRSSYP